MGHADVQKWISSIDLAPASVRYVHRVFSLIMELAVRDGRIPSNPTSGVRLPKVAKSDKRFLTAEELHRLADAAAQYPIPEVGQQYRGLILLLGFCGLRWGEAAALRAKRVDLLRRPPHGCRVGDRGTRPTGVGNTEVAPIPLGVYPPVACATAH